MVWCECFSDENMQNFAELILSACILYSCVIEFECLQSSGLDTAGGRKT